MSERTAKRLRKEGLALKLPELNMSFGPNRRARRQRIVTRVFTKVAASHVVNDYTQQREPLHPTEYTNYVRHQISKANRAKKEGKI